MNKYFLAFMREYHKLSDKDFIWFPFMALRPAPDQSISFSRLIIMIFCFGPYGSLLWPLKQWLMGGVFSWSGWVVFALKSIGFFLLWFSCVTRPLWNHRAKQLKS